METSLQADQNPCQVPVLSSGAVCYVSLHPHGWRGLGSGASNSGVREEAPDNRQEPQLQHNQSQSPLTVSKEEEASKTYTLLCHIHFYLSGYFPIDFHSNLNLFFTEPKRVDESYYQEFRRQDSYAVSSNLFGLAWAQPSSWKAHFPDPFGTRCGYTTVPIGCEQNQDHQDQVQFSAALAMHWCLFFACPLLETVMVMVVAT